MHVLGGFRQNSVSNKAAGARETKKSVVVWRQQRKVMATRKPNIYLRACRTPLGHRTRGHRRIMDPLDGIPFAVNVEPRCLRGNLARLPRQESRGTRYQASVSSSQRTFVSSFLCKSVCWLLDMRVFDSSRMILTGDMMCDATAVQKEMFHPTFGKTGGRGCPI